MGRWRLLLELSVAEETQISSLVWVLESGCMLMCGCDFFIARRFNYVVLINYSAQANTTDGII